MDPILGLMFFLALWEGAKHAWAHSRDTRRTSRTAHVEQAKEAAGGTLSPSARRRAIREHDAAWWGRETVHGFPVYRTSWHSSWLAHKTAADQHRARREEARTNHLDTRASFLAEIPEHKRRQAEAQALIDKALEEAGQQAGGKKAVQEVGDDLARKRAEKAAAPPLPADSVKPPRDNLAEHLKAPMPDPRLNDAQRERDQKGQRNICAACGHPGTPGDPLVISDGYRVHQSHTTDPASGFSEQAKGTQGAAPQAAPSSPATKGSPVATTEMNYTTAIGTSKQIEAQAEEVASTAAQSPAGDLLDSLTGMGLDSGTLSDFAEVDDAHREYVKAAQRYGEAATAARSNLERSHGGIKGAVDDAPVDQPAQPDFYTE